MSFRTSLLFVTIRDLFGISELFLLSLYIQLFTENISLFTVSVQLYYN